MRRGRDWASAWFALAGLGTALPLAWLVPWVRDHGADPAAFVSELFSTRVGGFFGWDVIVSALVMTMFVIVQGRRDGVPHRWLPIAATFLIGVSCGLPLFLALRERWGQSARHDRDR